MSEPTIQDVLDRLDGLETRFDGLETRFDGLERKFDDLTEFVQATATGTAARFEVIEKRLGINGRQDPPPLRLV